MVPPWTPAQSEDWDTIDRIRTQFHDPRDQLLEMLKTWLTNSDNTSWNTLTDALRSRSVGASQLASVLQRKYCILVEETKADNSNSTSDIHPEIVSVQQPELVPIQERKLNCE